MLLPTAQLLARAILALVLGSALVVLARLPWVTVISGTLVLLMADGGLGLDLYRRSGPLPTPLLMMWSFNLGFSLMLVIFFRLQPLGLLMLAVMGAVATGVWHAARWGVQRRGSVP